MAFQWLLFGTKANNLKSIPESGKPSRNLRRCHNETRRMKSAFVHDTVHGGRGESIEARSSISFGFLLMRS
jgi:hypothetical protein